MIELKRFQTWVREEECITCGHAACGGCGGALAMRQVLKILGKRVVVVTCPSCVGTAVSTAMTVASSHGPFGSVAAWASGVKAGLEMQGDTSTIVLGCAGDGGTFDIGLQALSAAAERNEDIIFMCYDNEAYMMTGIQRSSATPTGGWTTTTPRAKREPKKNIMEIMAAHHIPYAASTSIGYPHDLVYKVNKAKPIKGMRFIHILAPCPTGWRYSSDITIKIARMAVESRMFPLYEVDNGIQYKLQEAERKISVKEYMNSQGRFSHLNNKEVDAIQKSIDQEWERLRSRCASSEPLR